VTYDDGRLVLEVSDTGAGSGGRDPSSLGSGLGIVGMRERAAAFGGQLEAGPRPEGGFLVKATFPLQAP
jgi:signal transduction histidine kinase